MASVILCSHSIVNIHAVNGLARQSGADRIQPCILLVPPVPSSCQGVDGLHSCSDKATGHTLRFHSRLHFAAFSKNAAKPKAAVPILLCASYNASKRVIGIHTTAEVV